MKIGLMIVGILAVLGWVGYLFLGPGFFNQFRYWDPRFSSSACAKNGGRWTFVPMPYGAPKTSGYCYYPPKDEGKECHQNSECEKDCVSTDKKDKEGFILGKCGEYSVFYCVPTIPFKTKDHKDLKGGACV